MLIQATDGLLYRNPKIITKNWILEIVDEKILLKHRGKVLWSTVRRKLPGVGVKSSLLNVHSDSSTVLQGRLVDVSVFEIKVRGPIPQPTSCDYYLNDSLNAGDDIDGEPILRFPKSKGRK